MSLSCECDYDYCWEFFVEEWRICRKPHQCSECRRTITKGERYHSIRGKMDGDFQTYDICSHCDAATAYIQAMSACSWCYYLGFRWNPPDGDQEFYGEPTAIRRLVVMARHKWTRRRGPRKGETYPVPWVPSLV